MKWKLTALILILVGVSTLKASNPDEGMWLPLYIKNMNEADMKKLGLKISADQIYSMETSSLKDAVIRLNNGSCTAELVSNQGLLFTNHHCGYDDVWEAISLGKIDKEKYLESGFWTKNFSEEIGGLNMSAAILNYIENITKRIYPRLERTKSETERGALYKILTDSIEKAIENDNEFIDAQVKEMFGGNEYYVYVYKVYKDVRIVASPPESIGKFGGDTDNWMWPRHTGDFSILRIYANADNEPALYDEKNKPFSPKHFLPVSLAPKRKGDFSMIMGYPGTTERYLTSYDLETKLSYSLPNIVASRTIMLDAMRKYMKADSRLETELKSFTASLANGWKLWQGQMMMARRFNLVAEQKIEDDALMAWVNADQTRKARYAESLEGIKTYNENQRKIQPQMGYFSNGFLSIQAVGVGFRLRNLQFTLANNIGMVEAKKKDMSKGAYQGAMDSIKGVNSALIEEFKTVSNSYFDVSKYAGNYASAHPYDQEIIEKLCMNFYNEFPKSMHPQFLRNLYNPFSDKQMASMRKEIIAAMRKETGEKDVDMKEVDRRLDDKIAGMSGDKSDKDLQAIKSKLNHLFTSGSLNREAASALIEKLEKGDEVEDAWADLVMTMVNDWRQYIMLQRKFSENKNMHFRRYMEALMKWKADRKFYPDANSTLRLTYGTVIPYKPRDGADYDYLTTHYGVLEKSDPNDDEFRISAKMETLLKNKDFGQYGVHDSLILCFLTNHDITGGNSGSPVIDANGNLIGIAFDGNWEAATSDFLVMPQYNRTISVDIRYVLWVIDKFGDCHRLIDELKITGAPSAAK